MRANEFNRRLIDDQLVYVRANTKAEAWARARTDDADNTSDPKPVKTTYRFIEIEE